MNPQQTPPNTPPQPGTSLDYLNQIAPGEQKRALPFVGGPLKPIHYILGGLLLLVVVIVIVSIVLNVSGGGTKSKIERLAARIEATATITNDATNKLKSTQLRTLNSNLKLILTDTKREMVTPFAAVSVDTTKLSKDLVNKESGTDMKNRLEDARLNAVYDSTYAREMAYQLDTILTLMKDIYSASGNDKVKEFLGNAYNNLEPTQEAFADFIASTE